MGSKMRQRGWSRNNGSSLLITHLIEKNKYYEEWRNHALMFNKNVIKMFLKPHLGHTEKRMKVVNELTFFGAALSHCQRHY